MLMQPGHAVGLVMQHAAAAGVPWKETLITLTGLPFHFLYSYVSLSNLLHHV